VLAAKQGPGFVTRLPQHDWAGGGVLGIRTQPNHPADDLAGILLSAVDGLMYGCGDAVIGVNPASGSTATVARDPRGRSRRG